MSSRLCSSRCWLPCLIAVLRIEGIISPVEQRSQRSISSIGTLMTLTFCDYSAGTLLILKEPAVSELLGKE